MSRPVALDRSQQAVVELPDGVSAAVLGAPGSGKTTTITEVVADRILNRGWGADEVLVLSSSRRTASAHRDVLALRIGVPTTGPLARTAASVAFEMASLGAAGVGAAGADAAGADAASAGAGTPRLITGGEQDADFAQLLAGHEAEGTGPLWPHPLGPDVRALRGFRTELRELLTRATDHGVGFDRLRELGDAHQRPQWRAAADFLEEYVQVSAWLRPGQYDSSELIRLAIHALDTDTAGERMSRLRLVLVDDMQEATESTLALLRAFVRRGTAVIAFGDPDVASNAFRGGEPDALGRFASVLEVPHAVTVRLHHVHRHRGDLRKLVSRTVQRIGTAAAGAQRAATPAREADPGSPLSVEPLARIEATTSARQWAAIARVLRERHLLDGLGWNRMCVVVRGGGQVPEAARALTLAEVPTRTAVGGRPLREDRSARALLLVVAVGIGRDGLSAETATEMLLGPFGGLDRLGVRRLRLALRAEEVAGGGGRSADELLIDALGAPERLATIDHRVGRAAARLSSTLAAVGDLAADRGSIEELIWLVWERSGLAPVWREQALAPGILSTEAHRNLDGVLALFTAAKRFTERRADAPPSVFLDDLLTAEVPEDTLSPQPDNDTVLVTTPSGAVGLEFDTVVIAGLQEGVWPDRRLRGSLLAAHELGRAVTGVDSATLDERRLVLDDELRMFALAVSRAQNSVVLAAVANDDETPSVFFSLLPPDTPLIDSATAPPLSLRAMTGRLRRQLADPRSEPQRKADAAATLARLVEENVPGADPRQWHGLLEPTTSGPLFDGRRVPVSPSRMERFEKSPLDWFLETIAGSQPTVSMSVGTILHWAMETAEGTGPTEVWNAVASRWDELVFESPWLAEHHRRAARVLVTGISEYLTDFAREGRTLVAAERRFTFEVGDAVVTGSIDRVERSADGQVTIVDLKTGNPTTARAEIDAHPQLGAYQLAYRSGVLDEFLSGLGQHSAGGAKLLWVKKGIAGKAYRESVQAPFDDDGLEAFRARVRETAAGMASARFVGDIELGGYGPGNVPRLQLHRVPAVSSD